MSTRKSSKVATADSFQNAAARLGMGAGSQIDGGSFKFSPVTRDRTQLEAAYRTNWLCRTVVDVVADDMTRAGVEFNTTLEPEQTEKLHKALDRLRVWDALGRTVKWSRLYGGAIAVILIDGQDMATPLDIGKIGKGQFKGLYVLDRWQIDPGFGVNDVVTDLGPELGMPKYYKILATAQALADKKVHYSRVIRIEGSELPWQQKQTENGWSTSTLESMWDRVVAFDSTTMGAAQLVFKAHLRTYKVNGLRDLIATGGKALEGFIQQMEFVRAYQTNEGLTIMDASDEFEAHSYAFSGLDSVLLQFGQQLSGATQIPLVRLFGQSPAGLSSTGESDLRTYYDGVSAQQNAKLRSGFARIAAILARSVLGVDLPEDSDFEFRPLWQLSDTEKSAIAKTIGEAVGSAEAAGVISRATALKELRQASRITGIFSNITDEDIDDADAEPPVPTDADIVDDEAVRTGDSEHWITVENGAHVLVDGDGNVIGGAGGNLNGKKLSPSSKSAARPGTRTRADVESDQRDLSKVAQTRIAEAHASKGMGVAISGSEIEHLNSHEKALHHELHLEMQRHEQVERQGAAARIAAKIAARNAAKMDVEPRPFDHGELNIPGRTNNINAKLDQYKAEQATIQKAEHKAGLTRSREHNGNIKALTSNKEAMAKYAEKHKTTPKNIVSLINEMGLQQQERFLTAHAREASK